MWRPTIPTGWWISFVGKAPSRRYRVSLGSGPADRRLHPREAADEPVRLITVGGHAYDAVVVDRSLRGLRILLDQAATLQGEVTVLARSAGAVYVARVVWRTPPYAGLSITRTVDMRTSAGHDTAGLHKLWREHIAR